MAKQMRKPFDGDYPITQNFGENPAYYAQYGMNGHNGTDYGVPEGQPIYAGVNGKITLTGNAPNGYGLNVKVWDPSQNLELIYAHLKEIRVSEGQEVGPNTVVGLSGNTGKSTGPHLHFGTGETDIAGMRINRENGYDGWLSPGSQVEFTAAPAGGTAPAPGYTGPTPPPYAPTHAGQTVSYNGNSFRSDDGKTWIFQGSDADRAAEQAAKIERDRYIANQKIVDAGVYFVLGPEVRRWDEGVYNPHNYGLSGPERMVIKGNWLAYLTFGIPADGGRKLYDQPGDYPLNDEPGRIKVDLDKLEVYPKPPPPEPAPITEQPATVSTPPPPPPPAGAQPTPTGALKLPVAEYKPWELKTAPGTKRVYDFLANIANKILGQFVG